MNFKSLARPALAAAALYVTAGPALMLTYLESDEIPFKTMRGYDATVTPAGVLTVKNFPDESGDYNCTGQLAPTSIRHNFAAIFPAQYQSKELDAHVTVEAGNTEANASTVCISKHNPQNIIVQNMPRPVSWAGAEEQKLWKNTQTHACWAASLRLRIPTALKVC